MQPKTHFDSEIASIIMAAGRGSRMKGYEGNKTLLPLCPGTSTFEGSHPILLHLLTNLPTGEKALIVKSLEKSNWVKNKAAKLLQLNRTTLVEKIKRHHLEECHSYS